MPALLVTAFALGEGRPHTAAATLRPVALAAVGNDRIALLNADGQIDMFVGGKQERLWRIGGSVVDMAGMADSDGSPVLMVSSTRTGGSGDVIGTIDVRPSGWSVRTTGVMYTGVALRSVRPFVAFAASARTQEIVGLTYADRRLVTRFLGSVPDAEAVLGALAIEPQGKRLYVADTVGGRIWTLSTLGGTATLFASGLRDVRALAADGESLFVADGDGRRVLRFKQQSGATTRQGPSSALRITSKSFRLPVGLGLLDGGMVAVGDRLAQSIFVMDGRNGTIVRTLR